VLTFRLDCFQNENLPEGGRHLDAVVTVSAADGHGLAGQAVAGVGDPVQLTEVLLLDASGSMDGEKFRQARAAIGVAVAVLAPGTRFAVVAGTTTARQVYPARGLAVATADTKADVRKALRRLRSGGGTAIGQWLLAAGELVRDQPGIRHVTLLTDGRNQNESEDELDRAVEAVAGILQCDCRGVGDDWSVAELRLIATRLLGTVDIVATPDQLVADFAAIGARVAGLRDPDMTLRVWTPAGVWVERVQQVSPEVADLLPAGADAGDYRTGAWGAQTRSYQLRLLLPSGSLGEEMLAARVSLVRDGAPVAQAQVRATWTDDLELSTRMDPYVAHYTGQTELSAAVGRGLAARRNGDDVAAAEDLGRARVLAAETGSAEMLALLDRLVDVDATNGRARLRTDASAIDEMTLDTRSTRTTGVRRLPPAAE
jgi:hypothetical protein